MLVRRVHNSQLRDTGSVRAFIYEMRALYQMQLGGRFDQSTELTSAEKLSHEINDQDKLISLWTKTATKRRIQTDCLSTEYTNHLLLVCNFYACRLNCSDLCSKATFTHSDMLTVTEKASVVAVPFHTFPSTHTWSFAYWTTTNMLSFVRHIADFLLQIVTDPLLNDLEEEAVWKFETVQTLRW